MANLLKISIPVPLVRFGVFRCQTDFQQSMLKTMSFSFAIQSNSRKGCTQGHSAAKPHQTRKLRSEKRTGTREAYGVRRIPALWIYFMDKNEKRRDAAHSIRFALLDAFLISQAARKYVACLKFCRK